MKELNLEEVKTALTEMGIPYKEDDVPENLMKSLTELVKFFNYTPSPLWANLTNIDTVDAELGIIVRNSDLEMDNGVYIFTVLHSGQAGFIVVEPSTMSRAPLIRKVTGDLISAVTAVDLPPLQPFDMIEITAHLLAGTFMKVIMESCNIPKEYEQPFLHLYMPKFLANVGMYFAGAVKEDGSPMVYEETANIEPMIAWRSIMKGAGKNEGDTAGETKKTEKEQTEEEAPLP